jgi:integrase
VDGQPECHPDGCDYLRYLCQHKRVWESIGADADAAVVALRNKEHDLQSIVLGRPAAKPIAPPEDSFCAATPTAPSRSLEDAIAEYLDEVRRFRSPKTIAACEHMLRLFQLDLPGKCLEDITRKDLLDHMSSLKQKGLSDRTVFNHIMRVGTLLKANGVVGLLRSADKPRYDEKDVKAYNAEQLVALFAAATAEERMLFKFFLGTGFREQEVMFTTWKNIDLQGKVAGVRSKPELGFRIKDKEERSVPVPDSLIASLADRRKHSSSMFVFPGPNDKPDRHLLRILQRLAFRAGLNCGECSTSRGQSCRTRPVCGARGLHKFRKTFATMHSEAGVPARTIQRWLGHSDLTTTLRYLAAADLRSERTRNQVNTSFACLAMSGAA